MQFFTIFSFTLMQEYDDTAPVKLDMDLWYSGIGLIISAINFILRCKINVGYESIPRDIWSFEYIFF